MQLTSEQVAPYLSGYLMGGWREDELQLVAVEVERDRITGTVDVVRSFAAGFIFTTSLCPHLAAGALAAVRHLKQSSVERVQQQRNVERLKAMMREAGLPVPQSDSHILPLIIGDAHLCRRISEELLEQHGIYVQPINYPTVPIGLERLRITPTPFHTEAQMRDLVDGLVQVMRRLRALPPPAAIELQAHEAAVTLEPTHALSLALSGLRLH